MKNATELLTAYLTQIQDPAAAAALFADDGVIELPWVDARAEGPAAKGSVPSIYTNPAMGWDFARSRPLRIKS